MAKLKTAIGFHMGMPNFADGIGDYWRLLAENGHAIVAKGVANAGPVYEVQELSKQYPNVPMYGIWRQDQFPHGGDVPRYHHDPADEAQYYWNHIDKTWPPELDKDFAWVEFPNEADKDQSAWLGRFAYECGLEAILRGYKFLSPGWSGGEPEPEDWECDSWIDYFTLCQSYPDRLGISTHEYTFRSDVSMLETKPYLIGRIMSMNTVCWQNNIVPPTVFVSEWGYGATNAPDHSIGVPDMIETVDWYIRELPNVKGVLIWCLDSNWQWSELSKIINGYIEPMGNHILATDWPEPESVPPPIIEPPIDPPEEKHKVVIWKVPQEYDLANFIDVAKEAYGEYRRTLTSSTDDMVTMLESGNEESYVVIWDGDEPSQLEATVVCQEKGFTAEYRYLDEEPSIFPQNIKLGFLMKYRYLISSNFNAPRSYANFLHEGQDIDIIYTGPDSKEAILCAYKGVVDRSLDSSGGYGKYVRVKHELDGNTFYTRYCHLDDRYVDVGEIVNVGTELGEIGTTGNVTGEHLHFNLEIPGFGLHGYVVKDVVNPAPYLPDPSGLPLYKKPSQKVYNLLDYLKGDGRIYEVRHPAGNTETFQCQGNGYKFYLVKNSQYESFRFDNEYIWRGIDTSPGPAPPYAERPGDNRFYDQFEVGQTMARWALLNMSVGQTFTGPGHTVAYYYKNDCSSSKANAGPATNIVTFVGKLNTYEGYNGIIVNDVVVLQTNTGEKMYFANGFGLVGWESDWGESKISEIHSGRDDLVRETIPCLER